MHSISIENIIALLQLPKIGRKTAYKLLSKLDKDLIDSHELLDLVNRNSQGSKLPTYSVEDINSAVNKAQNIIELSQKASIDLISFLDERYPKQLLRTDDFPIILNVKGNINSITDHLNVAIIGTREPTEYGFKCGKRIGSFLAENGFNVVSGLAVGCDTAGHLGALSANGTTTAVLAHGLDTLYPRENQYIVDELLSKGGAILSEYFIKQRPIGNFFIERDRIQAGLSDCVLVIETDIKGGTMHTVKYSHNYSRILACLKHPLEYLSEPKVQGNQMLIREGKAIGVFDKNDIDKLILKIKSESNNAFAKKEIEKKLEDKKTDNQLNLWD